MTNTFSPEQRNFHAHITHLIIDICLSFDDVIVYLNLIGVQDSLLGESAQPKNGRKSPDAFPR